MNPILHILRKELREMLRDKRVTSTAFFAPVLTVLMMGMMFGVMFSALDKKKKTEITVVESGKGTMLVKLLGQVPTLKLRYVPTAEAGQKRVRDGASKLVLDIPAQFDSQLATGQGNAVAYFDPAEPTSSIALNAVRVVIDQVNKKSLDATLKNRGLSATAAEPIKLIPKETTAGDKNMAGSIMVGMLPYFIVIWAFYGGMGIASDLVAGEKERGTMETLLISPVKRSQVALGKFLALAIVCLGSSLMAVLAIVLLGVLRLPGAKEMFPQGMHVGIGSALAMLAVVLPMVAFFAGVLVLVSAYARNMREAQTYLGLISLVIILPAVFSQVASFTDVGKSKWISFVPVLNSAMSLREALLGRIDMYNLAMTVGVSLALAALAIWAAVSLFQREKILVRI